MLSQLHIQNIAVIQKASVQFSRGLNVFTGETGAGKTILISALDAVLGERTSRDIIRTGEEKAQVSALFESISPAACQVLEDLGYSDDDGSVLISREIQANGKGSCRINGMPATVSILKEVASRMIHIHGQRDSLQLLAHEHHLELIDAFGITGQQRQLYQQAYRQMCETREALDALQMDEAQKAHRIDMLSFQLAEIEAAQLEDPDEEENLLTQRGIIRNSEKIRDALLSAYAALQGDEELQGINSLMNQLTGGVQQAAGYISELEPMADRVAELTYELAEYARDIRTTLDGFEFDPQELDAMESRLDLLHKLKRKYGANIEEILLFQKQAQDELNGIISSDERAMQLAMQLQTQTEQAQQLAETLSDLRQKAAQAFVRQVEDELAFLDMPAVKLSVHHQKQALSPLGIDQMELYIVTNVGEEPKPLSRIASGGEVARIMLAIKNVLAEKDDIATLIFDEVDTGVSGRAAQKIGQKLGQVALGRQVICVTHLAQVAAFADHHLLIHKEVEAGRTFTRITVLEGDETVQELARITSGDMVTEAALQSARELRAHSQAALKH